MWEEREMGRRDLSRSVLVTAGQARGRPGPQITQIPNFSISPMPLDPVPGAALARNGEGRAGARWEDWGHDTSRVGETTRRWYATSSPLVF